MELVMFKLSGAIPTSSSPAPGTSLLEFAQLHKYFSANPCPRAANPKHNQTLVLLLHPNAVGASCTLLPAPTLPDWQPPAASLWESTNLHHFQQKQSQRGSGKRRNGYRENRRDLGRAGVIWKEKEWIWEDKEWI